MRRLILPARQLAANWPPLVGLAVLGLATAGAGGVSMGPLSPQDVGGALHSLLLSYGSRLLA